MKTIKVITLDIQDVKNRNERGGGHWFGKGETSFFNIRYMKDCYAATTEGNIYFVSSERFSENSKRLYTVRCCFVGGRIKSMHLFHGYTSNVRAKREAMRLAENEVQI